MIVVDASLMIAWLLEEAGAGPAAELDELLEHETIVVPAHWSAEIGNALVVNVRRGRIPPARMQMMIEDCSALNIIIEPVSSIQEIGPLAQFASAQNLTFYDAAYVQIALERSIPLGTLDHGMRRAAQRLGLSLFPA